ncbi:menaquinone-dependent protoporphyrinogen oxidase [Streptomyces sp. WMMB 714]|uniref:flavodoxin domain-containing protein n=1 Tax=Streptomyces sp. WMMB 714 TaxID=1286822 RepID=UPI0005F86FE7|nr:flavodoxin domain-containing protein [Streptomyces sp. WMMB 714]SCK11378.1 menaquinone-dependent protoporphyrinogen oxidase [Streptomyces sp. WMMB 714]
MASPRVLVAYSSRNRSTSEIASWIGAGMRDRGLHPDISAAEDVKDLSPYDAVVLGSALYVGRWRRGANSFARRHHHELVRVPVWLFSSGPLDLSAARSELPPPPQVARLAKRLGAEEHRTFGGRLTDGATGFLAGQMLKERMGGDFRNQQEIRAWGREIAAALLAARERI